MHEFEREYTELVEAYSDGVYNFVRFMIRDADDREDIVQQTFISLYHNLPKLRREVSLKPWIFKVAKNQCLDFLKRKKALVFSELPEVVLEIPNEDESVEAQVDLLGFMDEVKTALADLPHSVRDIMLLKYFEDMTFEEIAEIVSLPVNTVKSHFYRGKQKIYSLIKR